MDERHKYARAFHRSSIDSTADASFAREQRDHIVRELRAEDPVKWSYAKLAEAVGCSKGLIRLILKNQEARNDLQVHEV